jgi:hypothetical protein
LIVNFRRAIRDGGQERYDLGLKFLQPACGIILDGTVGGIACPRFPCGW